MPDIVIEALQELRRETRIGQADPAVTLRVYGHLFRKRDDMCADAINAAVASIAKRS
jgi:hypothetical protein